MPSDQFKTIVAQSFTLTEVLSHFSMRNVGSNNLTLKRRIKEEGVDISHFRRKGGGRKGPRGMTLEECMSTVFIEGKVGCKSSVRRYLRRFKLVEEKCAICSLGLEWNGQPLTLQLDHISGDSTDDRVENLRWICPNCHSQTDTYTGKANKGRVGAKIFSLPKRTVPTANETLVITDNGETNIVKRASMTRAEINAKHRSHWPSKETLSAKVWEKPLTHLKDEFGFKSITSLKQMIKLYQIQAPPVGFWARLKAGWSRDQAINPPTQAPKRCLRKFTDDQVREIRSRLDKGDKPAALARAYGCSHKTMRDIRDRQRYVSVV